MEHAVGPTGTLASRAPSVRAADSDYDEGLPGADTKNTGDDARLQLSSPRPACREREQSVFLDIPAVTPP